MFFLTKATRTKERLKDWWTFSKFNRIDLLTMLIALVGLGIRIYAGMSIV